MRTCKKCGNAHEVEEFPVAGTKNDVKYYRHVCNTCYVKTKKKRRNKNAEWLLEHKKTLSCNRCNNNDHRVLEFHHLRDKEFTISNCVHYGKEKIMDEINKCEVLCANCHRIEHYN